MSGAGRILQLSGSPAQGYLLRFLSASGALRGTLALQHRPTLVWLDSWARLGYRIQDGTDDRDTATLETARTLLRAQMETHGW